MPRTIYKKIETGKQIGPPKVEKEHGTPKKIKRVGQGDVPNKEESPHEATCVSDKGAVVALKSLVTTSLTKSPYQLDPFGKKICVL